VGAGGISEVSPDSFMGKSLRAREGIFVLVGCENQEPGSCELEGGSRQGKVLALLVKKGGGKASSRRVHARVLSLDGKEVRKGGVNASF